MIIIFSGLTLNVFICFVFFWLPDILAGIYVPSNDTHAAQNAAVSQTVFLGADDQRRLIQIYYISYHLYHICFGLVTDVMLHYTRLHVCVWEFRCTVLKEANNTRDCGLKKSSSLRLFDSPLRQTGYMCI